MFPRAVFVHGLYTYSKADQQKRSEEMSEVVIKQRNRQKWLVISILIILVALVVFWAWHTLNTLYQPVDARDKSQIDVIIPAQATAPQIAAILDKEKLIRSQTVFLLYCRRAELDSRLKAGHYRFSRSLSTPQIAELIAQGHVAGISFTVPEGYTIKQIGDLLVKHNICTEEDWKAALWETYDYDFLDGVPVDTKDPLEGFLFPDTYEIEEGNSAIQIVDQMLKNFGKHWAKYSGQAVSQNKSVYETVILASIIEREAMVDGERPLISGVIQNRLRTGMLLQLCPTVLYCIGQPEKVNVSYQDLEVDSPYNTYKYPGLTPGPISCPGDASLAAALNPQASPYFYYVAKGDGTHYFSRTYQEHLQAQRRYSN